MLINKFLWCSLFVVLLMIAMSSTNNNTLPVDSVALEWATKAQTSFFQAGLGFSMFAVGFGSYNATKSGHFWSTLAKQTNRLAGLFGGFGAFASAILAFIPTGDSPEVSLMKAEFAKLSQKMDTIATSLDDTKNLIKLETQKAAYVGYELKINAGFSQMHKLIKKLENVTCQSIQLKACKRKKMLIAEGYIKSLNIRESVNAIYQAVTTSGAFTTSILELVKQGSSCNIPQMKRFINKVVILITKGLQVSIMHDLLTKHGYDFTDDTILYIDMLHGIESKRQAVQDSCFKDFDYWMSRDVANAYSKFEANIEKTNAKLLNTLNNKYPWILWLAITYRGTQPIIGPLTSKGRLLHSSSTKHNVHSFVIPTTKSTVQKFDEKKKKWINHVQTNKIGTDLTNFITKVEHLINNEPELNKQVESFAVLPGDAWVSGHYQKEPIQKTLGGYDDEVTYMNIFVNKPFKADKFLIAVTFKQVDPQQCTSGYCNNKGVCYPYPYSIERGCKCRKSFIGNRCEKRVEDQKLKQVANFLISNTMKLPTFTSIQHAIQDTQLFLKTTSENIRESIIKLETKLDLQFKNLGQFVSNEFNWFSVLLNYKESIENLHYFHSIFNEKVFRFQLNQNVNITQFNTSDKSRFSIVNSTDIAKYLLSPVGVQKWLYQINLLIVGRSSSQFNSHKSLLFLAMDKYKNGFCLSQYKNSISRAYRQLMLLQLQGYMLWSKAYSSDDRDSSIIANRYGQVLSDQKAFLKRETCNVKIPNSKNAIDCIGGYYIHKSLKVSVSCKDGFFLRRKLHQLKYIWI